MSVVRTIILENKKTGRRIKVQRTGKLNSGKKIKKANGSHKNFKNRQGPLV